MDLSLHQRRGVLVTLQQMPFTILVDTKNEKADVCVATSLHRIVGQDQNILNAIAIDIAAAKLG